MQQVFEHLRAEHLRRQHALRDGALLDLDHPAAGNARCMDHAVQRTEARARLRDHPAHLLVIGDVRRAQKHLRAVLFHGGDCGALRRLGSQRRASYKHEPRAVCTREMLRNREADAAEPAGDQVHAFGAQHVGIRFVRADRRRLDHLDPAAPATVRDNGFERVRRAFGDDLPGRVVARPFDVDVLPAQLGMLVRHHATRPQQGRLFRLDRLGAGHRMHRRRGDRDAELLRP